MAFDKAEPTLFYRVAFDKTTIWIPVHDGQGSKGLPISPERSLPSAHSQTPVRRLTPRTELAHYRAVLASQPVPLADDFRTRQGELENRLRQGGFLELCETVRDLNARSAGTQLSKYEFTLLGRVRLSLQREWAASSGTTEQWAAQEITDLLTSS